jgi:hypothetical protein
MKRRLNALFSPLRVIIHRQDGDSHVVLVSRSPDEYALCRVHYGRRTLSSIQPPEASRGRVTAPLNPTGIEQVLEWCSPPAALKLFEALFGGAPSTCNKVVPLRG